MMSGGKDSTYLALKLVREYKLNLLGMSIDNGFEYSDSFDNAKKVCDQLGIPYIILQPNMLDARKFYHYIATENALRNDDYSQICFFCGTFLKRQVDIYAQKFDIPFIFAGYNPDQAAEMGETDIIESDTGRRQYFKMIKQALVSKVNEAHEYTLKNYLVSGCKLVSSLIHLCRRRNIPDYIQKEFSAQIRKGILSKETGGKCNGGNHFL